MTDYTPTMDDYRASFLAGLPEGTPVYAEQAARFDAALADYTTNVKAEAWDEGAYAAGLDTCDAEDNPYRKEGE